MTHCRSVASVLLGCGLLALWISGFAGEIDPGQSVAEPVDASSNGTSANSGDNHGAVQDASRDVGQKSGHATVASKNAASDHEPRELARPDGATVEGGRQPTSGHAGAVRSILEREGSKRPVRPPVVAARQGRPKYPHSGGRRDTAEQDAARRSVDLRRGNTVGAATINRTPGAARSAVAAERQFTGGPGARWTASRPDPHAGVVGGPRDPGPGTVGGAAPSKLTGSGAINGTAMRRRF